MTSLTDATNSPQHEGLEGLRLDPSMVVEAWDDTAKVTFDRRLWSELQTLRFLADRYNVLILGPVGVWEKPSWPNALAHLACRRGKSAIQ